MSTTVDTHRLERNAVGLAPTLFQSITHMAPAAAVAFSIIVGVPYAGGSIPLAVLLAPTGLILHGPLAMRLLAFQSLFWSPGYDFVESGDLNGDGKTDFALYNSSTGTMYTGISNGAKTEVLKGLTEGQQVILQ